MRLGVPPMVQTEERVIPVGRDGEAEQEEMTPPVLEAWRSVRVVPRVAMTEESG